MQSSKTGRELFSHGEFPAEIVRLIAEFVGSDREESPSLHLFMCLNKQWLQLLVDHVANKYMRALFQCHILMPTQASLNVLYETTLTTATTLSAHVGWWAENRYRQTFIRHSENYTEGLNKFFRQNWQHPMEKDSARHLQVCSTQLVPSLNRYGARKALKMVSQIFREHAPMILPEEKPSACTLL